MTYQMGHSSKKRPRSPELSETHKKYVLSHDQDLLTRNKYYLPSELEKTLTDNEKTNHEEHNKKLKIPPIYLYHVNNYQEILKDIKTNITGEFTTQNRPDSLKINLNSEDDFRKLTAFYDEQNVQYYTYQNPEHTNMSVVIRNIPISITETEIENELKANYNIKKVTRLLNKDKKPIPICAVEITKDGKELDIFKLQRLNHSIVEVQPRRKSSNIPQCTRCQRFGHTKNYCKLEPRCIKCLEPHHYSECPKSRNDQPMCVNCGENHTANYRGCSYYVKIKKLRMQTQVQNNITNNSSNRTNTNNYIQQGKSYANVTRSNNNNTESNNNQQTFTATNVPQILRDLTPTLSQIILNIISPFIEQIKEFFKSLFSSFFSNGR